VGDSPEKSIRDMFPKWPVNTRGKKEMTINSWLEFREALDDIQEMYLILEQGDGSGWTASEYVITTAFLDDPYLPCTHSLDVTMQAKLREFCEGDDRSKFCLKHAKSAGEMIQNLNTTFAGENSNYLYGALSSAVKFATGDMDVSTKTSKSIVVSKLLNHCASLPDLQMSTSQFTALLAERSLKDNRNGVKFEKMERYNCTNTVKR